MDSSFGRRRKSQPRRSAAQIFDDDCRRASADHGLALFHDSEKGWGVYSKIDMDVGTLVSEYHGQEMSQAEGEKLEEKLKDNPDAGCFFYYSRERCIDGTYSTGLARYVNHTLSQLKNLKPYNVMVNGKLRMFLKAQIPIEKGDELLYDYGDRKSKLEFLKYNKPPGVVRKGKLFPKVSSTISFPVLTLMQV